MISVKKLVFGDFCDHYENRFKGITRKLSTYRAKGEFLESLDYFYNRFWPYLENYQNVGQKEVFVIIVIISF